MAIKKTLEVSPNEDLRMTTYVDEEQDELVRLDIILTFPMQDYDDLALVGHMLGVFASMKDTKERESDEENYE